jgi:hypothetical protein
MKYGGGCELYNQLVEPYGVHLIGSAATGLEAFVTKKPIRRWHSRAQGPRSEGMVYDIFRRLAPRL